MLYTCVRKFDVMGTAQTFLELNALLGWIWFGWRWAVQLVQGDGMVALAWR